LSPYIFKAIQSRWENTDTDFSFLQNSQQLLFRGIEVFTEALIYSNLFTVKRKKGRVISDIPSLHRLTIMNHKYPFVCTILNGVKYFGVPQYFFRLSLTSAVESVPVCRIQWIHLHTVKSTRNCSIGYIRQDNWTAWLPHPVMENPYISFNSLLPSRFALSYTRRDSETSAYNINVAFVALDAENLGSHAEDNFYYDFGDNMFPNFPNSKNANIQVLEHDDDNSSGSDEAENEAETETNIDISELRKYISPTLINFMRT